MKAIESCGIVLPKKIQAAVESRKKDFLFGRYCAYRASELLLGQSDARFLKIEQAEDGGPQWPKGFTGSITHTAGYAAAILARETDFRSIGIDSQAWMTSEGASKLEKKILTLDEINWIEEGKSPFPRGWNKLNQVTFAFAAKESLYKCLRPLTHTFFGLQSAEVIKVSTSDQEGRGSFEIRLRSDLGEPTVFKTSEVFEGTFQVTAHWIHTEILLK